MMTWKTALPLPVAEMGVTAADFVHQSAVHGVGHVNRVIFWSLTLCAKMGWQDLFPAAWAAAHLHDLARRQGRLLREQGPEIGINYDEQINHRSPPRIL